MENVIPSQLQAKMDELKAVKAEAEATLSHQSTPTPQQQPPTAPPTAAPASTASSLARPGTPPQQHQAQGPEDWEHKYRVLDGMFRKQTSELREEIEHLKQELAKRSTTTVSSLNETLTDSEIESLVAPDQLEEYGYDYWRQQIKLLRTVAKTTTAPDSRLESIEEKLRRQEEEAFYSELDRLIPNWEQINDSPAFRQFLATMDPLTRISYNGLLTDAQENRDAQRAAALFRKFLSEPSRSTGFNSLVTPSGRAPYEQHGVAGPTMTYEAWSAELKALPGAGLSQIEMSNRQKQLTAMWNEGRVTGVPGR